MSKTYNIINRIGHQYAILLALAMLCVFAARPAGAETLSCNALFADGLQTHALDGTIWYNPFSRLKNAPDKYLTTGRVHKKIYYWWHYYWKTCGRKDCVANGGNTVEMDFRFPEFNGSTDKTLWSGERLTIGATGTREFNSIRLYDYAVGTFQSSDESYIIKQINIGANATLVLPAGDYIVDSLTMHKGAKIKVASDEVARVFVRQSPSFAYKVRINKGERSRYSRKWWRGRREKVGNLMFYTAGNLQISSSTKGEGFFYSKGDATLDRFSHIEGALNAANITLASGSTVQFNAQSLNVLEQAQSCDVTHFNDLDGDGIPDHLDPDRDGDGVDNDEDVFPDDVNEWADLDNDGIGDNADPDRDGDGFDNELEAEYGTDPNDAASTPPDQDGDKIPDDRDDDRDGDGVDNDDDAFPNDPNEWSDLDNDGIGDNADPDRDGDGFDNDLEAEYGTDPNDASSTPPDQDGDKIPDDRDDDRDGDGVNNDDDAFPNDPNEWSDIDNDGIGDNADPDRDGDGFDNDLEAEYGTDPNDPTSTPPDQDGDKIPDDRDDDRDGDGVNNDDDAFPNDPNEWSDLDNDGIGDNADPDRDGDGFDNEFEQSRNTDPNNADDYPDTVAPQLQVTTADNTTIAALFVTVTGTTTDPEQPYAGIAAVKISSEHYPDTEFSGSYDSSSGAFLIEVPLALGSNRLTIFTTDHSANQNAQQITIVRISPPKLMNISPANGSVVDQQTVNLIGEIHTYLKVENLVFAINESRLQPTPTANAGVYRFELRNIPLSVGKNDFILSITNDDGNDEKVISIQYIPQGADQLLPPEINVITPQNDALLNSTDIRIVAEIQSFAGPLTVLLDNRKLLEPEDQQSFYYLSERVTFPDAADQTNITISAKDSLGKTTSQTLSITLDGQGPEIELQNTLLPSPVINVIEGSPYVLRGTVKDNNFSSLLINNQSIVLQPTAEQDTYAFIVAVEIDLGASLPIQINAYDRSGNETSIEYTIENNATAAIEVALPTESTQFIGRVDDGNGVPPITIDLVSRTINRAAEDTVVAYLQSAPASVIQLAVNGEIASGQIDVAGITATETLIFELRDNANNMLAQDSVTINIISAADEPVELTRLEPVNNAQYIEPNASIEVYFNRAINVSQLEVSVRETLQGKSYVNNDSLGVDFINAQGYVLQDIFRNLEHVEGVITPIPGGAGVAFAANRFFGFNADVFIEISYEGERLIRSRFKVRDLPTFINGHVVDQFGEPIGGIAVALPQLNRSTKTNNDGVFTFGYQESGNQLIPGGDYRILANADLNNPRYGNIDKVVSIQQNYQNDLPRLQLQELDQDVPFYSVASGENNNLAMGELVIDLTKARALFVNNRTKGTMHAQFIPYEHLGLQMFPGAEPLWAFGMHPKGVTVEGDAKLSITIPQLRGSYDYIDAESYPYVVLLGYNRDSEVLEPIGVGQIIDRRVESVGKLHLTSLDAIAYTQVLPTLSNTLAAYANGEIYIQQLKAALQSALQASSTEQ